MNPHPDTTPTPAPAPAGVPQRETTWETTVAQLRAVGGDAE